MMVSIAAALSLSACAVFDDSNPSNTGYKQTTYGNEDLSGSDVRKVQRSLASEGYYKGRIDGIWGKQTSQAILDYQRANLQPQTGVATVETLQEFGVRMDKERLR